MRWPWMSKKRHEREMTRLNHMLTLKRLAEVNTAVERAQRQILGIEPGHIGLPGEPLRLTIEISDALMRHSDRHSLIRSLTPFIARRVDRALFPEGQ